MELQSVLEKTLQLLRQGETGQAIHVLLEVLSAQKNDYPELLHTVELLSAQFNTVRQNGLKGLLSTEAMQVEYNKINDALLSLVETAGQDKVPVLERTRRRSPRIWWLLAVVLAAGFFLVKSIVHRKSEGCPKWKEEGARVIILPFTNLTANTANATVQLRDSIEKLTLKNHFPVQLALADQLPAPQLGYLAAADYGLQCSADLVLWGSYHAYANDSISIKIGYVFPKKTDQPMLGAFRRFADVTEIGPDRDLVDAIFKVCTLLAADQDNMALSRKWLGKIRHPDEEEQRALHSALSPVN